MPKSSHNVAHRRMAGRQWSFGNAVFDEAKWALMVAGRRAALEQKPLELLHELLLNAGNTVSKDTLLERVWADVTVVEASLPTAIAKLRKALGDTDRSRPIIETVAKVGYCLAVPVTVSGPAGEGANVGPGPAVLYGRRAADHGAAPWRWLWPAAAIAAAVLAGGSVALASLDQARPAQQPVQKPQGFTNQDVHNAVKRLDVARIDAMLAAGWNPAKPLDAYGTTPLTLTLEVCEWNPAHDRQKMVMIVRSLVDNGAQITQRNVFGDTAYSIARAKRFCGADHPATVMIRSLCMNRQRRIDDSCLALRRGVLER